MKKIYLFILLLLLLVSCKNNKSNYNIDILDIYGRYYYDECIYLDPSITYTNLNEETTKYHNIARFVLNETSYYFYDSSSTEPLTTMKGVSYEKKETTTNLKLDNNIKELIKDYNIRFDIIYNKHNQGYAFIFGNSGTCYIELRYDSNTDNYEIYKIIKIRKYE